MLVEHDGRVSLCPEFVQEEEDAPEVAVLDGRGEERFRAFEAGQVWICFLLTDQPPCQVNILSNSGSESTPVVATALNIKMS